MFDVSVDEASVVASVLVFYVPDEELFELVFDWLLPWLLVDPADVDVLFPWLVVFPPEVVVF